ncbi:MAG: hypothetical protein ACLQPH_20120 [Acidimicrobiales bacterium]
MSRSAEAGTQPQGCEDRREPALATLDGDAHPGVSAGIRPERAARLEVR